MPNRTATGLLEGPSERKRVMDDLREWRNRAESAYRKAKVVLDQEDLALRRVIVCLREIRDHRVRQPLTPALPVARVSRPRQVYRATLSYVI